MRMRAENYVDTFELKPGFIIENKYPGHLDSYILGQLFNDMIWNLAIESEDLVSDIIKKFDDYYPSFNISLLKKVHSPFTSNNAILFFINGEAIRRTSAVHIYHTAISKIKQCFQEEIEDNDLNYDNITSAFYKGLIA